MDSRRKRRTTAIELSDLPGKDEQLTVPSAVAINPSGRRPSFRSQTQRPLDGERDDDSGAVLERTASVVTATSKSRTAAVIASVTLITAISSLLNGLTTVALPTMAADLHIDDSLLLWPSSIQALTCGCTLLISGAITDALGARFMYILGSVLQSGFVLACGLSRNAAELIIFRGLSGIAVSLCLPSAVSIITSSFEGKRRNVAFASMGGGQPVGFSVGLAIGGVLTDDIGWRWGFYISGLANTAVLAVAIWGLPAEIDHSSVGDGTARLSWGDKFRWLKTEVDWVGAFTASVSLAMLSYVLASVTGSQSEIRQPVNIALLAVAVALIPAFIFWVGRQEGLDKPTIIPNSLWRNRVFTTITTAVFLTWGSFNALEAILTFFFQKVQLLSATESSIRFLPEPVAGMLANLAAGLLVHRVPANWLVLSTCLVSLVAPLTMVFATPDSSYWSSAFIANVVNPLGADALFTVANLLITSVFPRKTQALAGGVFNTISQIGKSVGLALVAVIAADVTAHSDHADKKSPEALLEGYKAAFWFCFASIVMTLIVSAWGLRGVGRVGHKLS